MKPRLEVWATPEDCDVWIYHVCRRWPYPVVPYDVLWASSYVSDRRDARLMLQFIQCRDWPAATRHTLLGTIGVPYPEIEAMLS